MDIVTILISSLALIISILSHYYNRPKLKIKQIKVAEFDKMIEDDEFFYPNFVLKITNLRKIPVEISSFSIHWMKITIEKDINSVIKPFSTTYFYVNNWAILILLKAKEKKYRIFDNFMKLLA